MDAAELVGPRVPADTVCVTAMTWRTPLGSGLDDVWRALLAGVTGVRSHPARISLRGDQAALVPGLDPDLPVARRLHELTTVTLRAAFADAGLEPAAARVAVVIGTSYGADLDEPEATLCAWADAVGTEVGCARPVTVSTACSAGADAILVAAELVRNGGADICIAGGVDVVSAAKRLGHSALGTLSRTTLRALDVDHDGMVPGEGAAFVVLESASSAAAREVEVLAHLLGGGASNDASGLTAPDETGESVVLAVQRATVAAGVDIGEIAVVNAHATGTALSDAVECASLNRLFTDAGPTVFATKGALGHSLGATGAIEAICTVLALRTGMIPPVHGLHRPLTALTLDVAASVPELLPERPRQVGASITIGFGGFNTCLLFALQVTAVASGMSGGSTPARLVAHRETSTDTPRTVSHNNPALFADPAAWVVADAVAAVLADPAPVDPDRVALVVCSDTATCDTMRRISAALPSGRVSPLRFAGANPGVVAGLSCITLGLRGPSLVLTGHPRESAAIATMMAQAWLRDNACDHVVLVEHVRAGERHTAGATLVTRGATGARRAGRAA